MLSLKIKFADDIRRVSVEPSISYSTVQDLVQKLYTSALPSPFCFKYVDEEGDLITISSENDWREAASSGRPLTLTVHTGGSTISTPTPTPTPTPATTTNVDGFEMLFTSQQLLAAAANANAPTPVAEPDPAAILSFDPEVTPSSGSDNNTNNDDEASRNVNIDDLPLQERLEALLVEAIFSGEKFLDEVLASLKRQTANTELPTIHELLEGFFQPLREAYRTSGTKACEFFAALQEHAQSSMLLARIASMISLASDSIAKSAATSSCEISNKLGGLSIDQHIRSFVTKIETHPDVQVLVTVLKQKLAAMRPQQQHFSAEFVADVTIADGSELTQNQRVVKTWRVRNNGNTAWPVDVKLFDQDNVVRAEITSAPAAGEEVEVSIDFTPTQIDVHTEYFTLRVAEGAELRLWIHFIGVPAPEFPAEYAPLLAQLEAMGFVRDSALAALTATEGNLNEATDLLLNSTQ